MNRRFGALVSVLAITLAGCAGTVGEPANTAAAEVATAPTYPDQAPLYSDLDNPMQPQEMQTATILDVDRYRPTYRLAACTSEPIERAAPTNEMAQALAEARAYSEEFGGVGLIVMLDGKIVHESYAQGADETTLTASASKMKSVLSLLYGIAIDKGIVGSIDDPAGIYLSEWSDDPRGAITLRQLMTMSSGLGQTNFMELIFSPDVGAMALQTPIEREPDTEFVYSNGSSAILATVLDRKVKDAGYASLPQFLHSELWCPMGGGEALLWVDASGKARGYAGLHANLRDWAKIGELVRNRGVANGKQIVASKWVEEMTKPSASNEQYGLHVWLGREWTEKRSYSAANPIKVFHSEPFASPDMVYFDGFGGQRVYVVPSQGLTIARSGIVNLEFDDSKLPNTVLGAMN